MTLVKSTIYDGGVTHASRRQRARIVASDSVAGAGSSRGAVGAAREGAKPWEAVPATEYVDRASGYGPRRRRMIEGASTTSHADIR